MYSKFTKTYLVLSSLTQALSQTNVYWFKRVLGNCVSISLFVLYISWRTSLTRLLKNSLAISVSFSFPLDASLSFHIVFRFVWAKGHAVRGFPEPYTWPLHCRDDGEGHSDPQQEPQRILPVCGRWVPPSTITITKCCIQSKSERWKFWVGRFFTPGIQIRKNIGRNMDVHKNLMFVWLVSENWKYMI